MEGGERVATGSGPLRALRADDELRARALALAAPGLGDAVERHTLEVDDDRPGGSELHETAVLRVAGVLRQSEVRVAEQVELLAPNGGRRERRRRAGRLAVVDDAGSRRGSL